jgi:hypothetical protein
MICAMQSKSFVTCGIQTPCSISLYEEPMSCPDHPREPLPTEHYSENELQGSELMPSW